MSAGEVPREIAEAPARTAQEGTARVTTYTAANKPVPTPADLRGSGTTEFAARRAHVTNRIVTDRVLGAVSDRVHEEGDRRMGRLALGITRMFAEPVEFVLDGQRRYIRPDPEEPWSRTDDPVDGPRHQVDPLWALDALVGANPDATVVEETELAGVPTTRWRLTVNLHRADASLPFGLHIPDKPAKRRLFRRPVDEHWEQHVPAEVWLDSEGRVRRTAVAPLAHLSKPGQEVLWHITDLSDFGEPDPVAVPEVH